MFISNITFKLNFSKNLRFNELKKVYVEMVRKIVESGEKNNENY